MARPIESQVVVEMSLDSIMPRDSQHNPDPKVNAARIVEESTRPHEEQPANADVESAWRAWSAHVQKVDERTLTLPRAAFKAGFDAGQSSSS
jgi:hypothetical protein